MRAINFSRHVNSYRKKNVNDRLDIGWYIFCYYKFAFKMFWKKIAQYYIIRLVSFLPSFLRSLVDECIIYVDIRFERRGVFKANSFQWDCSVEGFLNNLRHLQKLLLMPFPECSLLSLDVHPITVILMVKCLWVSSFMRGHGSVQFSCIYPSILCTYM